METEKGRERTENKRHEDKKKEEAGEIMFGGRGRGPKMETERRTKKDKERMHADCGLSFGKPLVLLNINNLTVMFGDHRRE